ncbi:hypothetical protein T265_03245 [Opisthorchis viverrini]|uniref:Uncharacterized protein n=1 Tax=Opisthorchis viverrini TaxID=6198 RepID=A0A074ZT58_OPIVI|nr:hypothetical protein T265_03245 [Opisthorchis viverrini]KER30296.1 hypothetical protein T265_03245 [Opisthorchis viverrini]
MLSPLDLVYSHEGDPREDIEIAIKHSTTKTIPWEEGKYNNDMPQLGLIHPGVLIRRTRSKKKASTACRISKFGHRLEAALATVFQRILIHDWLLSPHFRPNRARLDIGQADRLDLPNSRLTDILQQRENKTICSLLPVSSRFRLRTSGDAEAAAAGYAGVGIVLSERAEASLLDWIPVDSSLCAVRLATSLRETREISLLGQDGPSGWSANLLTGRSVVQTRPRPLDFPCLGLGNLTVSQPSCGMAAGHRKGVTNERFFSSRSYKSAGQRSDFSPSLEY